MDTMRKTGLKLLCCLLALCLLPVFASAQEDDGALGTLKVINCESWVSLRAKPNTAAERLIKVPLNAYVYNCRRYNDAFVYCEYEGRSGYILSEYLEKADASAPTEKPETTADWDAGLSWSVSDAAKDTEYGDISAEGTISYVDMATVGTVVLDGRFSLGENSYYLFAVRQTANSGEMLSVGCYDANYRPLWGRTMKAAAQEGEELLEVFLSGTEEHPFVVLYNAEKGLQAVDFDTGAERWRLEKEKLDLGVSVCWAVDEYGTLYIAGAHGPDPVAINARGGVLWMSHVDDAAVYSPYRITVTDYGILTDYASTDIGGSNMHYQVGTGFMGEPGEITLTNIP